MALKKKKKTAAKKAAPKKRNGVKAPAKKRPTVKRKPAVKKPVAKKRNGEKASVKKRATTKRVTPKKRNGSVTNPPVKYALRMSGKLVTENLYLEPAKEIARDLANKNQKIVLVNTMTRQYTGAYKLTAQRSIRPVVENPIKKPVKKAAPKKRNGIGSTIKKAVKKTIRKTVHKAAAKIASKTKNPVKRKPPVKKRTRRNPANGTAYEMFTGQDYKGYFEMSVPASAPANLDELGTFYEFKWKDLNGKTHTVDFKKAGAKVVLCCDRNRTRLWVAGSAKFPLPAGDHGEITQVTYQQKKIHLGDKEKTLYFHNLGEETGERPIFQIDKDGRMLFKGGAYTIKADGIHN